MSMSSDDIIHHMACDMSQWICEIIPDWPYRDQPGDSFTDAVCLMFGDAPTKDSVIRDYSKKKTAQVLRKHLNRQGETNVVTESNARALIERLVINNFGHESLSN
jgi:hypothetical protein